VVGVLRSCNPDLAGPDTFRHCSSKSWSGHKLSLGGLSKWAVAMAYTRCRTETPGLLWHPSACSESFVLTITNETMHALGLAKLLASVFQQRISESSRKRYDQWTCDEKSWRTRGRVSTPWQSDVD